MVAIKTHVHGRKN